MAIKMKRGTTESWSLGPELIHFENTLSKDKDSVIRAEGTELEMYVYTESANEWYISSPNQGGEETKTDGKIPGLPINTANSTELHPDDDLGCQLKIQFLAPEDCALEYLDGIGSLHKPLFTNNIYIDENYKLGAGVFPQLFIKWPAEQVGVTEPVPIKIRVSLRENGLCEELEEGQLGVEYTENNNVRVKIGMPSIRKWNELPYIGIVPPLEVYFTGTEDEVINLDTHYYKIHNFEISHTVAECRNAIAEGRMVYFLGKIGEHVYCGSLSYAMPDNDYESGYTVVHCISYYNPNDIRIITLRGYEEWFDDMEEGIGQISIIVTGSTAIATHSRIDNLELQINELQQRIANLENSSL